MKAKACPQELEEIRGKKLHKLSRQSSTIIDLVCYNFKFTPLKIGDLYVAIYTALFYNFKGDQFKV